ncbi:diversity-generating retroelement protein Avd [Pelomicrobium methylotrophicum]|uniref:Diversity-generating retroelement protein Avd n=1 Tax=Pelomicrobium methylotrophicum TaxID=2602750 RepID=A0A5C7ELG6_9PROT|nr:diversity-generating retroelement protein Avd [Pelomicrobium methylotrophicum]TXF11946.1 diversity-generating retroelement protein Avd [Pelomicrobium methylotrophicum]
MDAMSHADTRAAEPRAISRIEQAARHSPYQALIEKLEELDAYSHQVMHQWPKIERHVLAAEVRASLLRARRLCAVAWKRRQKSSALFDLDIEIEVLRHFVRKAYRLRYITAHRLHVWARHIDEIGRMIGAWIKHEEHRA